MYVFWLSSFFIKLWNYRLSNFLLVCFYNKPILLFYIDWLGARAAIDLSTSHQSKPLPNSDIDFDSRYRADIEKVDKFGEVPTKENSSGSSGCMRLVKMRIRRRYHIDVTDMRQRFYGSEVLLSFLGIAVRRVCSKGGSIPSANNACKLLVRSYAVPSSIHHYFTILALMP